MAKCRTALSRSRCGPRLLAVILSALALGVPSAAHAQAEPSLSQQDVLLAARALHFLQPTPSTSMLIAVVYAPDTASSLHDAQRIVTLLESSSNPGGPPIQAMALSSDSLTSSPVHFTALIGAVGASPDVLMSAARVRHVVCITADVSVVEAARCVLFVRSAPRVEIVMSQAAADACGIAFAAAFRLMARQV